VKPPAGRTAPGPAAVTTAGTGTAPAWVARAAVAVIAITAVALLAVVLGPHRIGDYYTETDFYGGYAEGARLIQYGRIDPARYGVVGPVYELALALVGGLTRDLFVAGEAISIAAALGTLALWFTLLRRRVGPPLALATIAFLAANPTFFRYGYSVTSDMLAVLLVSAAMVACLASRDRRAPLAAGALAALAALTRYSAIALFPGLLIVCAWSPGRSGRLRAALACAAGFAVVAAPWLAFAARSGHLPGALLFHDIAFDIYASGRGQTWAEYQTRLQPGFHSLLDVLIRDPGAVLRREGGNALTHLAGDARDLLGWPVTAACLLGLALALKDGSWRKLTPIGLVGVLLYVALIPAFQSARYSLVLAPFDLTLAGALAASVWTVFRGRARTVPAALAAVALATSAAASVSQQRAALETLPVEIVPAAKVLRGAASDSARVMAVKPHVAAAAGLGFVPFPSTTKLDEVAAACASRGVRYLYYSWIEANSRPSFWYLLDPQAAIPGLTRLLYVNRHPAALYRVDAGFGPAPAWLASDSARSESESRLMGVMPAEWAWRARLSLAVAAREQQRYREVLDQSSFVIRLRPAEPDGWRLFGDASVHLGDREPARQAFERALALEPENTDTRIRLGWLSLASGDEARAAAVWNPAAGATSDRATLERMIALFHARHDTGAEARARESLLRTGAAR
jgi:tetratricopeptide (TPR) repeat protein